MPDDLNFIIEYLILNEVPLRFFSLPILIKKINEIFNKILFSLSSCIWFLRKREFMNQVKIELMRVWVLKNKRFQNILGQYMAFFFQSRFWFLTRRLSGFEILNNPTLILQKWLVSRHFANIFHYLNFSEEYLWQFS